MLVRVNSNSATAFTRLCGLPRSLNGALLLVGTAILEALPLPILGRRIGEHLDVVGESPQSGPPSR